MDQRGRPISPHVLVAAEELSRRAIHHAEKLLVDPAVAANLLEEAAPTPQLVYVRYSPRHNVNYEWVYNHADIIHSHVIWARDLGAEHNRLLLQQLPDRTVWLLEADRREPQLVPYAEAGNSAPRQAPMRVDSGNSEQD